jgi:hypothetical protein
MMQRVPCKRRLGPAPGSCTSKMLSHPKGYHLVLHDSSLLPQIDALQKQGVLFVSFADPKCRRSMFGYKKNDIGKVVAWLWGSEVAPGDCDVNVARDSRRLGLGSRLALEYIYRNCFDTYQLHVTTESDFHGLLRHSGLSVSDAGVCVLRRDSDDFPALITLFESYTRNSLKATGLL